MAVVQSGFGAVDGRAMSLDGGVRTMSAELGEILEAAL
jgi:hypothetical protein